MTGNVIAMVIAVILALAGALELRPSNEERIAMLIKDGQTLRALDLLKVLRAQGNRSPPILSDLYKLESDMGHVEAAVRHLEDYVAVRPDDLEARAHLANLHAITQNVDKLIANLEQRVARHPNRASVKRLLSLYRMHGKSEAEKQLLWSAPSGSLGEYDTQRLANMLVAEGDQERAMDVLLAADNGAGPSNMEGRKLLCRLLAANGHPEAAVDYVGRWKHRWQSLDAFEPLLIQLAKAGHMHEARRLVSKVVNAHPNIHLTLALRSPQYGVAPLGRLILADWTSNIAKASQADIAKFVTASVATDDPGIAISALMHELLQATASQAVEHLTTEIGRQIGDHALTSAAWSVPELALARHPLLAARIALIAKNRVYAEHLLQRVDVERLPAERRREWAAMLADAVGPNLALVKLSNWRTEHRLTGSVYKQLTSYIKLNPGNASQRTPIKLPG